MLFSSHECTNTTHPHKLLIIACSQRKRSDPGLLPAIIRYDGPSFFVLRRFLRQCISEPPSMDVYILSAEFGLISQNQLIPNYDRRMTAKIAQQLHLGVITELKNIANARLYQEMFICIGRDYLPAINGYQHIFPANLNIEIASGSLGGKLSQLHDWLYGKPPEISCDQPKFLKCHKKNQIRGINVTLTPQQVLDVAYQALQAGNQEFTRFQSWYVVVGNNRVAPKWLVSQLTGLSVGDFTTKEALRLLSQLGIVVKRV
ncbi:DUF6884 domain-containing protein [Nostoc sp. FACHB-280]|uniref:DUF6884 domain-containing protein n=1 Tax=Nostoc sp. FACHB-280 TaxID=2692839 RepID=UPI00168AFC53|nr:DUF6884 domain-containing protein [Nostoc sp. FACHB-280]MBD2498871.1 hypothetical protein [Nostoc sp. FACHB-280]